MPEREQASASTGPAASGGGTTSSQERAEALMERMGADIARFATRAAGRAREEIEDLFAEARAVQESWGSHEGG